MDYKSIITLEALPVIRGLQITADKILRQLTFGETETKILSRFPGLTSEDIGACVAFDAARRDIVAGAWYKESRELYREIWEKEADLPLLTPDEILLQPTPTILVQQTQRPNCGKVHREVKGSFRFPRCSSCGATINAEGFAVKVQEETTGRRLKLRTFRKVMESSDVLWNLRRAKRRFVRFYDNINRIPLLLNPGLCDLAAKIIEERDKHSIDQFEMDHILSEEFTPQTKCWDALREYEYRKRAEPFFAFSKPA